MADDHDSDGACTPVPLALACRPHPSRELPPRHWHAGGPAGRRDFGPPTDGAALTPTRRPLSAHGTHKAPGTYSPQSTQKHKLNQNIKVTADGSEASVPLTMPSVPVLTRDGGSCRPVELLRSLRSTTRVPARSGCDWAGAWLSVFRLRVSCNSANCTAMERE